MNKTAILFVLLACAVFTQAQLQSNGSQSGNGFWLRLQAVQLTVDTTSTEWDVLVTNSLSSNVSENLAQLVLYDQVNNGTRVQAFNTSNVVSSFQNVALVAQYNNGSANESLNVTLQVWVVNRTNASQLYLVQRVENVSLFSQNATVDNYVVVYDYLQHVNGTSNSSENVTESRANRTFNSNTSDLGVALNLSLQFVVSYNRTVNTTNVNLLSARGTQNESVSFQLNGNLLGNSVNGSNVTAAFDVNSSQLQSCVVSNDTSSSQQQVSCLDVLLNTTGSSIFTQNLYNANVDNVNVSVLNTTDNSTYNVTVQQVKVNTTSRSVQLFSDLNASNSTNGSNSSNGSNGSNSSNGSNGSNSSNGSNGSNSSNGSNNSNGSQSGNGFWLRLQAVQLTVDTTSTEWDVLVTNTLSSNLTDNLNSVVLYDNVNNGTRVRAFNTSNVVSNFQDVALVAQYNNGSSINVDDQLNVALQVWVVNRTNASQLYLVQRVEKVQLFIQNATVNDYVVVYNYLQQVNGTSNSSVNATGSRANRTFTSNTSDLGAALNLSLQFVVSYNRTVNTTNVNRVSARGTYNGSVSFQLNGNLLGNSVNGSNVTANVDSTRYQSCVVSNDTSSTLQQVSCLDGLLRNAGNQNFTQNLYKATVVNVTITVQNTTGNATGNSTGNNTGNNSNNTYNVSVLQVRVNTTSRTVQLFSDKVGLISNKLFSFAMFAVVFMAALLY